MRTTVTLDPDVEQLIKWAMRERGMTFKQAINDAVRSTLAPEGPGGEVDWPTYSMGEPKVDLTKALSLAGRLEDDELLHELRRGK